jgi:hypothetical protein
MLATRAVANVGPKPGMASSRLLVSFDRYHAMIEGQDLGFQRQQLSAKSSHAGPCYLGEPGVVGVDDDFEHLLDAPAPDGCDDPELGKVRADGIDDSRLLANEQMSCAVKAQAALLLGCLGRHEAHVWPSDGFANRFCVSRIILLSFDIGLDIGRRHQAHRVTERLKFTRPIMRRCTTSERTPERIFA